MAELADRDRVQAARARLDELGRQTYLALTGGRKHKDGTLTGGQMVGVSQHATWSDTEVGRLIALREAYRAGSWSRDGHLLYATAEHDGTLVPVVNLERLRDLCATLRAVPAAAPLLRALQQQQVRALATKATHAIPLAGVDALYDHDRRREALSSRGFYAFALPSGEVRWVTDDDTP